MAMVSYASSIPHNDTSQGSCHALVRVIMASWGSDECRYDGCQGKYYHGSSIGVCVEVMFASRQATLSLRGLSISGLAWRFQVVVVQGCSSCCFGDRHLG